MKLLYISHGHPLLEADDCLTFKKLGIDYFSTGYYADSDKPGDLPRIENKFQKEHDELFRKQHRQSSNAEQLGSLPWRKNHEWTGLEIKNQIIFNNEFLDIFDCILISHNIENLFLNDNLWNRKVFVKTFSMHSLEYDRILQEFPHVKRIKTTPNYIFRGEVAGDYTIRQSAVISEEELGKGWTGENRTVCTFSSFMSHPAPEMRRRTAHYLEVIKHLNKFGIIAESFGAANDNFGHGFISHEEKIDILQRYRSNLCIGTPGTYYTYSTIESLVMGQPIVMFGKDLYQSDIYEADSIIKHGINGFIGNTPEECANYIKILNDDIDLAYEIGREARKTGISVFGREVISQKWKDMFVTEGLL